MRVRGNCEHAAPTWTGTKPSPTPSLRPPKPSTNSNPGLSHERVAPGGHMPGAAIRLDAELMSNRSSAPIGLSLAALDRRLGKSSADCCSAVPPTQQRRRDGKAAQIATATEERIDPVVFAGPADLRQPRTYVPTPAAAAAQSAKTPAAILDRPKLTRGPIGPRRPSSLAAPPQRAARVSDCSVAVTERGQHGDRKRSSRRSRSTRSLRRAAWASSAGRHAACLIDC
jgi:hypothetical protein